jgi:hypothetical protein
MPKTTFRISARRGPAAVPAVRRMVRVIHPARRGTVQRAAACLTRAPVNAAPIHQKSAKLTTLPFCHQPHTSGLTTA